MAGHYAKLKNLRRDMLIKQFSTRRAALKAVAHNRSTSAADPEKFAAQLRLQNMPRNSSITRKKNRCRITGRPRGYIGFFGMSRVALRDFAAWGLLPGVKKSSW